MFDRAKAVVQIKGGKCACAACQGELTAPVLSRGNWGFCRVCRCAWKISTIDAQTYATAIHAPAHAARPGQATTHRPTGQ